MAATFPGMIRKRLLAPDTSDVMFATRGFSSPSASAQEKLEMSGLQVVIGFEVAIEHKKYDAIITRLEALDREYRGFAYEGAAMALTIQDVLAPVPHSKQVERFLSDKAPQHIFMAYIGVGFALARLPKRLWSRALPNEHRLPDHPTLKWLILDGYGFHLAYFDHRKWVAGQHVDQRYPWDGPSGYTNRAIDQGIGRAMWFVYGGDVDRLLMAVDGFAPSRRGDLLSGIGLAATYAGGANEEALQAFLTGAKGFRSDVALGAVFALRARAVADLVVPHNELASQVFCGLSADEASKIAAQCIVDLPEDGAVPAYEIFRQRIQQHFR